MAKAKCIFCLGGGKISKEHLFALWLKEFFPRDEKTNHKSAYISWLDEVGEHSPLNKRKFNQGHVGSRKVRAVCENCNNGWLSQLETRAKNALPPLIFGDRCNILEGAQTLLSTWAAKTAMVMDQAGHFSSVVSQEERSWLMDHLTPPKNWFVWISAYNGKVWADLGIFQDRVGLSRTPVAKPSDAPYDAQVTTFGVGRIYFCVISGSSPDLEGYFSGRECDGLVQIWPTQPRSIIWPPATFFGDKEAYALANIFTESNFFDNTFDPGANWTFRH